MFAVSLDVPLSQSEIKDKDLIGGLVQSYAKVVRLNIPMNKMSVVDILNSGDHLVD